MTTHIHTSTLLFLSDLGKNNNREWFQNHKNIYDKEHFNMISFADCLIKSLKKCDNIETENGKKCLYRIYRDTRFSKDKTPYKTYWAGGIKRATKKLRGGYYFHIEPGNSYLAGGFFGPNSEDLARIRKGISYEYEELKDIILEDDFTSAFGEIKGDRLKTAPKGFPKDHPALEFLRLKQFILKTNFSDNQITSDDFVLEMVNTYKKMHPFFNFMSEILTTDENGTPI